MGALNRFVAVVFGIALASSALAFGTYRAGSVVLAPNDPVSKVVTAMGKPMSKEAVNNRYGAQVGEFWYYQESGKLVKFMISGGRVVQIEEIRN